MAFLLMRDLFQSSSTTPPATSATHVWRNVPYGYELIATPQEYRLYGPYVANLATILHQCGGHWSPELLAYQLPLGRAPQIDLMLRKYQQSEDEFDTLMDKLANHIDDSVAVPSSSSSVKKHTQKHRQQAIANRCKVIAEQFQVGDKLRGRSIIDFGKRWQEYPNLSWRYTAQGVCHTCGQHKGLSTEQQCQSCTATQQGILAVTYCYAYFD